MHVALTLLALAVVGVVIFMAVTHRGPFAIPAPTKKPVKKPNPNDNNL